MNSPQANLWTVGWGKALLNQGGLRGGGTLQDRENRGDETAEP